MAEASQARGSRVDLTSCSEAEQRLIGLVTKTFASFVVALGLLLAPVAVRAWGLGAGAIMQSRPVLTDRWHYDTGLVLSGFESVWRRTGDRRYLDYVRATIDGLIG